MDNRLLLEFLSRPRNEAEIAAKFRIPVSKVKEILEKAVNSGDVVVRQNRLGDTVKSSVLQGKDAKDSIGLSSGLRLRSGILGYQGTQFFQARPLGASFHARLSPDWVRFGFRNDKASHVKARKDSIASIIYSKSRTDERPGIFVEMQVLEFLNSGTKPEVEIKSNTGISQASLNRLVKTGLVHPSWGRKGVGVFFRLTSKGSKELARLKAASTPNITLSRGKLISAKTIGPR